MTQCNLAYWNFSFKKVAIIYEQQYQYYKLSSANTVRHHFYHSDWLGQLMKMLLQSSDRWILKIRFTSM